MQDYPFISFDPIDPECAMGLIFNWVQYHKRNDMTGYKRSFRISFNDLEELSKTPGYHGIRVYFGKSSQDHDGEMRLILVPVNECGEDIVKPDVKIYDFSMPCPPTCTDPKSPYFEGKYVADICKREDYRDPICP